MLVYGGVPAAGTVESRAGALAHWAMEDVPAASWAAAVLLDVGGAARACLDARPAGYGVTASSDLRGGCRERAGVRGAARATPC